MQYSLHGKTSGRPGVLLIIRTQAHIIFLYIIIKVLTFNASSNKFYVEATHSERCTLEDHYSYFYYYYYIIIAIILITVLLFLFLLLLLLLLLLYVLVHRNILMHVIFACHLFIDVHLKTIPAVTLFSIIL